MRKSNNVLSAILCVCAMVFCLGLYCLVPNGVLRADDQVLTSGNWTDEVLTTTSLEGAGTETSPYLIATAHDLVFMRNKIAEDISYAYAYYKQTADIDLAGHYWIPIDVDGSVFFRYDGNGKTISNMNVTKPNTSDPIYNGMDNLGFVSELNGEGEIKNLNFENAIVEDRNTDASAGIIAGSNYGTISGCGVSGRVVSKVVGGIAASNNYKEVKNCTASVVLESTFTAGGIVASNGSKIDNCIVVDSNIIGTWDVGGIVGCNGSVVNVTDPDDYARVTRCVVYTNKSATSVLAKNGSKTSSGGIVGSNINNAIIDECMTDGVLVGVDVTTSGFGTTGINNVIGATNVALSDYAGGIAGFNEGTISNVYSKTAEYHNACVVGETVGGLVGWNIDPGTITNAYAVQRVVGGIQVSASFIDEGAVIGRNGEGTNVSNVYYSTDVSNYGREPLNPVGDGDSTGITGKTSTEMVFRNTDDTKLFYDPNNSPNKNWLDKWTGAWQTGTTGLVVYPILKFLVDDEMYVDPGTELGDKIPMPYERIYTTKFTLGVNSPSGVERINISGWEDITYTNTINHYIELPDAEILENYGENAIYQYNVVWYYGAYDNYPYSGNQIFSASAYKAYLKKVTYELQYYLWDDDSEEYSLVEGKDPRLKTNASYVNGGATLTREHIFGTTLKLPVLNYQNNPTYPVGQAVIWQADISDTESVFNSSGCINEEPIYALTDDVYSKNKIIKLYGKIQNAKYSVELRANGYKDTNFVSGSLTNPQVSGGGMTIGTDVTTYDTLYLSNAVTYGEPFDLSQYNGQNIAVKDITSGATTYTFLGWGLISGKRILTTPEMTSSNPWDFATSYTAFSSLNVYGTNQNNETVIYLYAIYTTKEKTVSFYVFNEKDGTPIKLNVEKKVTFNTTMDTGDFPNTNTIQRPVGMKFDYWYYMVEGEKVKFEITQRILADLGLYAGYKFETFKVSFDKNNSGAEYHYTGKIDVEYTAIIGENLKDVYTDYLEHSTGWLPTKVGYVCTGWYEDTDCTKPVFVIDNSGHYEINSKATMPGEDKILYAGWRAKVFRLSLNANGGTANTLTSIDVKYGEDIVQKLNNIPQDKLPTRVQYGMVAWSLDQSADFGAGQFMGTENYITTTGTNVEIGGTTIRITNIMPDLGEEGTEVPVYAVWRARCTVTLDTGSGKLADELYADKDKKIIYLWRLTKVGEGNQGLDMNKYVPKLEGFTFEGWYIVGNDGKITESSPKFSNDYYVGNIVELRVRAKWEIDPNATYVAPDNTQGMIITLICVGGIIIALAVSLFFHAKSKDGYVSDKQFQKIQSIKGRYSYNPYDKEAKEKRDKEIEEKYKNKDEI